MRRLMREEGPQGTLPDPLQAVDQQPARRADRGQPARPRLHRGGAESTLAGDKTEFVVGESGTLYLAAITISIVFRGRLGAQCRQ